MSCFDEKDTSRFLTSFSRSLDVQQVIEIGLQFPSSFFFPPLKIGITRDFLFDLGKYPWAKHLFLILSIVCDIESAQSLYYFGETVSGPSQLDEENDVITL